MSDALLSVLRDALPRAESAYLVGFTDSEVEGLSALLTTARITVVTEAHQLTDDHDAILLGPQWEDVFADAPERTFEARLHRVGLLLRAGGTLAMSLPNLHSTSALLNGAYRRGVAIPLEGEAYDLTRPASPQALREAFVRAGLDTPNVHEIYGGDRRWAALGTEASHLSARCTMFTDAVAEALESNVKNYPALPARSLTETLAAAGVLFTATDRFVAVAGGRGRSFYRHVGPKAADVEWLDGSVGDERWAVGGSVVDPERPTSVPIGRSAQTLLLAALSASDITAFRRLAEQLGRLVATSSALDGITDLRWSRVMFTTRGPELGLPPLTEDLDEGTPKDEVRRDVLIALAWRHFTGVARRQEPEMPWPATFSDDELLIPWLTMSGIVQDRAAQLVEETVGLTRPGPEDSYSEAAAVAEASARIIALEDEVAALQETLRARDGEMAVRARAIRSLRGQVLNASKSRDLMAKANADIKNSAAFRLANQFRRAALITRPKKLVATVGKAADKKVRELRRAG